MIEFNDILYGSLKLPDWIVPFIKLPEFLRLRGVGLSNVDSYEFKDFNGPSRWEHSIAVAYLAQECAKEKQLEFKDSVHLTLAALLHDVATPPFAHTAEYVLDNFDHEIASHNLLSATTGRDYSPDIPVYAQQSSQFINRCKRLSKELKIQIDTDRIANMVIGEDNLGFLIQGTIDLDNAENVIRACLYLGIEVDKSLPLRIARWLAKQDSPPVNLEQNHSTEVIDWLKYRTKLYSRFYESSDEEVGREAFLQHIMRKAVKSGYPRRSLIWSTDEVLLSSLWNFKVENKSNKSLSLPELITRYQLIESPVKLVEIELETEEELRIFRDPDAAEWIEQQLSTNGLEVMMITHSRRYSVKSAINTLFKPAPGTLLLFKLGHGLKRGQLPDWLKNKIPEHLDGREMTNLISTNLNSMTKTWIREKPWKAMNKNRKENLISKLDHLGDWSFRLSKNDNIHHYPGTFVYSIPSNLISSLGLQGELVIDPFGGTGQTATEVIKYGGKAISADINSIACMSAEAKLSFLSDSERQYIRDISLEILTNFSEGSTPNIDDIHKWFHPRTLKELSKIWNYIQHRRKLKIKNFLMTCFSAILVNCTARKGKQHGYFADNTPLSRGETHPPYENPYNLFLDKITTNLSTLERLYIHIERDERDPEVELKNATVLKLNSTSATYKDYGIPAKSAAAIITSPPYLCMADYTLGQRLSYYWLFPDLFKNDFEKEIGARRLRSKKDGALNKYFEDIRNFAQNTTTVLSKGGFLAIVVGAPVAKSFANKNIFGMYDRILNEEGYNLLWSKMRSVQWHRNHGYERLKEERIAVYELLK